MKKAIAGFVAGIFVAGAVAWALSSKTPHHALRIGNEAPEFSLTDTNGKTHSLKQYRGKRVVLEWLNYDCPFVKKHYESGNMQALQKEYTSKGVIWLAIVSSAKGHQGYFEPTQMNALRDERKSTPTAILMDPTGEVGQLYGAKTTPHMYIINTAGALVYRGAIDDKRSADTDDIPIAKNFVREALASDLAGKKVKIASTKPYGCSVKY